MSTQAAALESRALAVPEKRPAFAGAWVVSGSMLLSGVLIYAFHVLAARSLGGAAYGQIAVLWAAMFIVVIVFFRPLEQTTARALADRRARGEEAATVVRSVLAVCVGLLAALGAAASLTWDQIGDRLFLGDGTMTAMLLVGIAAYAAAYVSRGIVTGARWFGGYGLGLVADAVARIAIAAPLVWTASKGAAAAGVTVAGLVGALVPLWVGRRRLAGALAGGHGARFHLGSTLAFAGPASVIAAVDQLLVNGSPLLVVLDGGGEASKVAGLVFAATMLVRVPVYVFQGLAASILPNLTRLQALEDRARFRRDVLQTAGLLLAAGGLIVAFAAVAGPESMRFLYGPDFDAGRSELVLLGLGVACYLAGTTFSQALLALDRGIGAAAAWAASAVVFVGGYLVLDGDALTRISVAFAAATVLDLALLGILLVRRTLRG
jgi:O-antigen/teichoic acid export membrane protein